MSKGLTIIIRGAGDVASSVAHRLHRCHFRILMTEIPKPQAVRRGVSFCEAVYEGEKEVEGVVAKLVSSPSEIYETWQQGKLSLLVDKGAAIKDVLKPDVFVDATISNHWTK